MMLTENVVFWRTPAFIRAYGQMDSATYADLKEQVIAGEGDIVTMARGVRIIKIAAQTHGTAYPRWLIVYAVYQTYELVVFITKYPVDADGFILIPMSDLESRQPLPYRKKFTTKQQMLLAKAKETLDIAVGTRFGKKTEANLVGSLL